MRLDEALVQLRKPCCVLFRCAREQLTDRACRTDVRFSTGRV